MSDYTLPCVPCGGTGSLPGTNYSAGTKGGPPNCYHCNGQRVVPAVPCPTCSHIERLPLWLTCWTCGGAQLVAA